MLSAITATIEKSPNQQLKIQVNSDKEVTVDELKEAGYTVKFLYNVSLSGLSKTAENKARTEGVIDASEAPFDNGFKYAVQVTDAEGNAIPSEVTADQYATVTVATATTAVEVTGVALNNELGYITKGETGVEVEVTSVLNALGAEISGEDLADITNITIDSIESDDVTVLYANDSNVLIPRKEGNVTLTVKFDDETLEPVTLDVEVKAAQEASSIEAEDIKVQAVNSDVYASSTYFKVLDQFGEELREPVKTNTTPTVKVTNSAGVEVSTFEEEDTYTVTVSVGDKELGSYKVTTVDVAEAEFDSYELSLHDDFKLDLKDETTADVITIKGFKDGVESPLTNADFASFKFVSSDKTVAEAAFAQGAQDAEPVINVTGKKVGKATISLVKVEGDIETTVATVEVEVVNTTPQISTLKLTNEKDAIYLNDARVDQLTTDGTAKAFIEANVTAGTDDEGFEIFDAEMIESVEYVAANNQVIVTLDELYGGKEFVFATVLDNDALEIEVPTTASYNATEKTVTFKVTFSEAAHYVNGDYEITPMVAGTETAEQYANLLAAANEPLQGIAFTTATLSEDLKSMDIVMTLDDAVANETSFTKELVFTQPAVALTDAAGNAADALAYTLTIAVDENGEATVSLTPAE